MEKIEVGEVFTIADESDEEQLVEVLAVATMEGTDYVGVSFVDDIQDDAEEEVDVFFLKVDENGDLDSIDSDEEFEKVTQAFDELFTEIEEEEGDE
ncbi:DUF1292 domain-containing protein [Bacillaceae bacterium S4-13-58]